MLDEIEIVRARAAARARAVRVTDGLASDRSLIESDYMTWLNAIFPEQMSSYRELADFHHDLLTHAWLSGAAFDLKLSSQSGFGARAKALSGK